MKTLKLLAFLLLISVFGVSQTHTFCPLDGTCVYTAAQASKIGSPDQAKNGQGTRVPTNVDIEAGSAASPTTSKYQTKPNLYISDYGSTDASNCITGLAAPCLSPLAFFEGTNVSATTTADLTGVMVDLYGGKASTSPTTWGNQWIGGAFQVWDSATPNVVQMTGLNPNVGALSVPAGCFKGTVGTVTCHRAISGIESDVTNTTATDGVWEQSVGNYFLGHSILYLGTNAAPADGTLGLAIDSGTVGHGWKVGQLIGSAQNVGLLIPQTHITNKPDIGIHLAASGLYGMVVGSGSTTYNHGISQTLVNPSFAGILFDAQRAEGNTAAALSNTAMFRAAVGASSYLNIKAFSDNAGAMHWQSDISNPSSPTVVGTFLDGMVYQPNATQNNGSLTVYGQIVATTAIQLRASGGNFFQINGTTTGSRVWSLQDTSDTFVGRATTDTFTGVKTFTAAPVISSIVNTGTLTLPTATGTLADVIASGTSTFTTTAVGAGACQTTVTTAATNTLTSDTISWAFASAPTAATDGVLHILPYVTANNVNFMRCNPTAGSITPTALVINWRVIR